MSNKGLRYLNNSINQKKLFDNIEKEVKGITEHYNFKGAVYVKKSDVGEITIKVTDPVPSSLIKKLDDYFELEAVLDDSSYGIDIIYKLKEAF